MRFGDVSSTKQLRDSPLARQIVKTRLVVAVVALVLCNFTNWLGDTRVITVSIGIYLLALFAHVLSWETRLEHKLHRAVPDVLDVILISVIVYQTYGLASPWFLLYLFPILSVARFLGRRWSVIIALLAAAGYGVATQLQGVWPWDFPWFWWRAIVLAGVALTGANLARSRDYGEALLLRAIEKIDRAILSNADVSKIMEEILDTTMDVTASKMSAIALIDDGVVGAVYSSAKDSDSDTDKLGADKLMRAYASAVAAAKEPLSLPTKNAFGATFVRQWRKNDPKYWSGRLVLLKVEDSPVAVLGVFSRRSLHYTRDDLSRLSSMAPLVALVRKNASVYTELQNRLQMLYEIGAQLKAEHGLKSIFSEVVRLVSERLGSEEAALFIPDERTVDIVKEAVWGPTPDITQKLMTVETKYGPDDNTLTREVFDDQLPARPMEIDPDEEYAAEYGKVLPSRKTCHYIGAALVIGKEVLGVIRVINKKTAHYTPHAPRLADGGFTNDDAGLLEMIATQVAAAIRSADFIEKNRYFEDLVYKSPDPIIVIDGKGRIRNFNEQSEKIWNRTEAEVLHEPVANFYSSLEEARRVGRALWEARDHTLSDFRTWIKDPDGGDPIPIRLSANLQVESDESVGSIGFFKDQRKQIRAEEERLRHEKLTAIGRLAQSSGHDIKHNLATILNTVASLRKSTDKHSEIQQTYSKIQAAAEDARSKVQNMLMTAGVSRPDKSVVSLKDILREFEETVAHEASVTDIQYASSYPESDPLAYAEAEQLRQVLANLFGNSVDAIKRARARGRRDAGRIAVSLYVHERESNVHEQEIHLVWSDDGIGMTEEAKKNAFLPFFTTKKTGNGLGLYITANIIENHGGTIALESAEAGIRFRITLPLYAARVVPPAAVLS